MLERERKVALEKIGIGDKMFGENLRNKLENFRQENDKLKKEIEDLKKERNEKGYCDLEKIRELLDKYETFQQYMEGHIMMLSDGVSLNFETTAGGRFLTTDSIRTFTEILKDLIDKMNVEEQKNFYEEIKDIVPKYLKNERDVRDWKLCFKDIIKLDKTKLKRKKRIVEAIR